MTNMFKKTLIASAVLAFAGTAQAATLQATASNVANELVGASDAVNAVDLRIVAGANYADNDIIRITFSNNSVKAANLKSVVRLYSNTETDPAEPPVWDEGDANTELDARLNLLSTSTVDGQLVAVYRVTNATINETTISARTETLFSATANALTSANLTGNLTATFSAETANGQALDTGGGLARTATLVRLFDQFATVEPVGAGDNLSAVIDVGADRETFVDDATTVTGHFNILTQKTGTPAAPVAINQGVTATKTTYTLTGDFSWALRTTAAPGAPVGSLLADALSFECNGATPVSVAVTAASAVVECNGIQNLSVDVDVAEGSASVIPTTTFSLSAVVAYDGIPTSKKGTKTLTAGAGSWTLNGSSVYIPYMLYGPTAEQTIQLTNKGSQTGDISASAVVGGQVIELGKVGVSNARSVTSLNAAIRNAMVAKGVNLSGPGNFAVGLTLITNVKAEDVTVYSAYQRGNGDRLVVVNDSNGATADLSALEAKIDALNP